ncbi:MAG: PIN domain-containing protein [Gemmataceae bacterium]
MKQVFADAFYFFALANEKDTAHARAIAFLHAYRGRLLTTEWVLTEVGDGFASPANRPVFLLTLETLRGNPNVTIVPCDSGLWQAGVELFRDRPDKDWSLTDCISFAVMSRAGIQEALTGDRHFEQAGFVALLK